MLKINNLNPSELFWHGFYNDDLPPLTIPIESSNNPDDVLPSIWTSFWGEGQATQNILENQRLRGIFLTQGAGWAVGDYDAQNFSENQRSSSGDFIKEFLTDRDFLLGSVFTGVFSFIGWDYRSVYKKNCKPPGDQGGESSQLQESKPLEPEPEDGPKTNWSKFAWGGLGVLAALGAGVLFLFPFEGPTGEMALGATSLALFAKAGLIDSSPRA